MITRKDSRILLVRTSLFFRKVSNGICDLIDPRAPPGCSWVQPQGC
jgi:hypothetical protein